MPPDAAQTAADPAPKKSKKTLLIAIVIVLGVALGGGAGAFLAGPLLAGGAPTAAAKGAEASAKADDHDATEGASTGTVTHLVENLVLNPAQSGGSRFLLLSIGFAVTDEAGAKVLADRDPELRDVVIRYFGAYTVDELVDIARRDSLKAGLRDAVVERFAAASVRDVYFPQFVVQ